MQRKIKNKKRKPKDSMPLKNINLKAIAAGHEKFLREHPIYRHQFDNSRYEQETKRFFRTPFISR